MELSTLIYIQKNNQTLMLHRNKKVNDVHAGKWNGLGGKLNPGETPEECIIREVKEESGLDIQAPQLKGVMTFPGFQNIEDCYVFLFRATEFSGSLINSPEGELNWIDDDQLLDLPMWAGDKLFFDWMKQDQFFSAKLEYSGEKLVSHNVVFY
ncbi:MAG: 8-oxo-dGTP diphosphatase [Candidatus Omnitrophota bacterium]|jgi:8-oxo-dGTP diphosphatase